MTDHHARVVTLLGNLNASNVPSERVQCLEEVEELAVKQDPTLLDSFFDELVHIQTDHDTSVKEQLINLFDCQDIALIPRARDIFGYLLESQCVDVVKRAIRCCGKVTRTCFVRIAESSINHHNYMLAWDSCMHLKSVILELRSEKNTGVLCYVYRYIATLVFLFSFRTQGSVGTQQTDPSLDLIARPDHFLQLHARTHTDGTASEFAFRVISNEKNDSGSKNQDEPQVECVVFVGPFEHHSNILPWREMLNTRVLQVKQDSFGRTDQLHLQELLENNKDIPLKVGSFSAASNVSGIIEEVDAITVLLHSNGCLACWDYAAAAPHQQVNMNPKNTKFAQPMLAKDAVFISPHKLVGGPGTPGILIIKKDLIKTSVPSMPGGGTVFYVSRNHHRYIEDIEYREEAGTPNIIGAIRVGLVFQLQVAAGYHRIVQREQAITETVLRSFKSHPLIHVLGNTDTARHPVFSFLIQHPSSGKFLHWSFATTLLNDLFGIQCRGGCSCAGPYGHDLLSISDEDAELIERLLIDKHEILRPGFVRLSIPYYWNDSLVQDVIKAILFVADFGYLFLEDYVYYTDSACNPCNITVAPPNSIPVGEYRHRSLGHSSRKRLWLHDVSYANNRKEDTSSLLRPSLISKKNEIN
eukprot:gene7749-628_t